MIDLAPPPARAFTYRLARQKKASPNTVAAYRDTCRLLLTFTRERAVISYLTPDEIDVLFSAPDRISWHGRRDQALLQLAVQAVL